MSFIEVRNLRKTFGGQKVVAVDNVSFDVEEGEMLVFLGPSGCGKTTTLRCIAGLERPDAGEVVIGGQTVFSERRNIFVPPERRGLGMVFQSYAVWPHMRVYDNVAYPLARQRLSAEAGTQRVQRALTLVGLDGLEGRYPSQLSGGQQQRVALARAIVAEPKAILFDEPLSNLDAKLRVQMRTELTVLQHRLRFTGIYVTHDQIEALVVAHRVIVMHQGRIEQIGPPRDVYHKPETPFVAGFVGHTNMATGTMNCSSGPPCIVTSWGNVYVASAGAVQDKQDAHLAIRAEKVQLFPQAPKEGLSNCWQGTVSAAGFLGRRMQYAVQLNGTGAPIRVDTSFGPEFELDEGQSVWLHFPVQDCMVFPRNEALNNS